MTPKEMHAEVQKFISKYEQGRYGDADEMPNIYFLLELQAIVKAAKKARKPK